MPPPVKDEQFLLLYGSQTGQAHAIAEDLHHDSQVEGLKGKLLCLNELKEDSLVREKVVIIVCSTTGDGDPPDNAAKFVRGLRKKSLSKDFLKNLKFTILGLGNTNYSAFCGAAKYIDSRLTELGATHFYDPGWADDAVGLDLVVEPWREGLWPCLKEVLLGLPQLAPVLHIPVLGVDGADIAALTVPPLPEPQIECILQQKGRSLPVVKDVPTKNTCQMARLTGYRCLTAPDAVRRTLQVELDISGTNLAFEAGDAICISCPNNPEEVDELLELLQCTDIADTPFVLRPLPGSKRSVPEHLAHATTLRGALTLYCDIRSLPEKKWLRLMAEFATAEEEKQRLLYLSSRQGNDTFTSEVRANCYNLTDLLRLNPSVRLPFVRVLELMPPLSYRFYSICTSPLAMPNRVQIAHNIIPNGLPETAMKELPGLCTNWIDALCGRIRAANNIPEQRNMWVRVPSQPPASSLAMGMASATLSFPSRPQSARARAHAWTVGPPAPKAGEAAKAPRADKPILRPLPKAPAAPVVPAVINPGITITMTETDSSVIVHSGPSAMSEGRPTAGGHFSAPVAPSFGGPSLATNGGGSGSSASLNVGGGGSGSGANGNSSISITVPASSPSVSASASPCPSPPPLLGANGTSSGPSSPRAGGAGAAAAVSPSSSSTSVNGHGTAGEAETAASTTPTRKEPVVDIVKIPPRLQGPPDPYSILIPVQRRQVNIFRVPSEPTVPVIMVGPGTGVSPFVGFLQHRRAMRAALPAVKFGEMWLFFGNRSRDKDFLFENEFNEYLKDGTLTRLLTAFSRDTDSSARYVQDCMRLHSKELARLMKDQRGVFFMCGNATSMAVSVDNTWVDILQETGMSYEEAVALKQKWYETKRYYKDVWG